jgi:NADPH:quinone reductase
MKKIILKSRPSGEVNAGVFQFCDEEVPALQKNQVLLQTRYLSVDPYMRNRMNNAESYIAPFMVDEVISGGGIGEVLESRHKDLSKGDLVSGTLPWQEMAVLGGDQVTKIPEHHHEMPTRYLGVLGLTGLTAYFGMLDIGRPKAGETVVISAAAGAVGSVAGQIAALKGCRVIGICGSEEKAMYLRGELKFYATINYKQFPNIRKELRKICPEKVDIYFDNVGGDISDAVFYQLNNFSRVVICGQIALYNLNRLSMGPRLFPQFLIHRTKLQGFIVHDFAARFAQAQQDLAVWLADGKINDRETIIDGFDNLPGAFLKLFSGDKIGKLLVRV